MLLQKRGYKLVFNGFFLTEWYRDQVKRWPQEGRVILAQYDDNTVVVYQAYRPAIGHFAAKNGYFGGEFSLSRMTWIKPNFLWMMYRCGWAQKEGQEVVLAIRIRREAFDQILALAVHSSFDSSVYSCRDEWKRHVQQSEVRLQWDPDHDPMGNSEKRRAIQLGLRGSAIKQYARDWIVDIADISDYVREQGTHVQNGDLDNLLLPREKVYTVTDRSVSNRLKLSR